VIAVGKVLGRVTDCSHLLVVGMESSLGHPQPIANLWGACFATGSVVMRADLVRLPKGRQSHHYLKSQVCLHWPLLRNPSAYGPRNVNYLFDQITLLTFVYVIMHVSTEASKSNL
jgi:hypothetical protein